MALDQPQHTAQYHQASWQSWTQTNAEVRLNDHPDIPLLLPQKEKWTQSLLGAVQTLEYRVSMGVREAISGLEVLVSPQGQQLGQPCDLHVQPSPTSTPVAAAPETHNPTPLGRSTRQKQQRFYTYHRQSLGRQHQKAKQCNKVVRVVLDGWFFTFLIL